VDKFIEGLSVVGPLIGVFVGWLLTRRTDKDKIVMEDKRKLKRTLHILLQIRYDVKLLKRDEEFITIYLRELKSKIPTQLTEKEEQLLRELFSRHIDDTFLLISNHNALDTKDNFESVINNLSETIKR
jgi:hypothetical protein